ncbi:hypothetical protein F503_04941 [Ophiostoma piceae UAMH 11346]|uniref:Uncharacterized protein n=1 Tax=Ophiostoma piceae (strain UAMH 11346) TaxID=1262450 RepID=S3CCN5_OPHP1|nr:hypothetical protein F503_04941 [Ophiostoma piceae UAMH 11346]
MVNDPTPASITNTINTVKAVNTTTFPHSIKISSRSAVSFDRDTSYLTFSIIIRTQLYNAFDLHHVKMCIEQSVKIYCKNQGDCVFWGFHPFKNFIRDTYCSESYRTGRMCYSSGKDSAKSWRDTCKHCKEKAAKEQAARDQANGL